MQQKNLSIKAFSSGDILSICMCTYHWRHHNQLPAVRHSVGVHTAISSVLGHRPLQCWGKSMSQYHPSHKFYLCMYKLMACILLKLYWETNISLGESLNIKYTQEWVLQLPTFLATVINWWKSILGGKSLKWYKPVFNEAIVSHILVFGSYTWHSFELFCPRHPPIQYSFSSNEVKPSI